MLPPWGGLCQQGEFFLLVFLSIDRYHQSKMKKFPLIIGLVTLIIIVGGVFLFSKSQNQTSNLQLPTSYEYYWGDRCPHCAKVEEFFSSWSKKDKINIDKKEVWKNPANAKIMAERAKSCSIPANELGVPLLYTPDGKCLIGDEPIIDFFKNISL